MLNFYTYFFRYFEILWSQTDLKSFVFRIKEKRPEEKNYQKQEKGAWNRPIEPWCSKSPGCVVYKNDMPAVKD